MTASKVKPLPNIDMKRLAGTSCREDVRSASGEIGVGIFGATNLSNKDEAGRDCIPALSQACRRPTGNRMVG